jgi:xylose isomerase
MGKLWGVHLNDQNGMKFDEDKNFGAENLRSAFNQIKVLKENNFCANGEYIGLDVKAMRTQKIEDSFRHIETSLKIAKAMEEKVNRYDYAFANKCIEERNYEALECYVLELIMGLK